MTFSVVQVAENSNINSGVTSLAATFTNPVAAGNTIVAIVNHDSPSGSTVTVDDNFNAGNYGTTKKTVTAAGDEQINLFILDNSAAGDSTHKTVTAHWSPSTDFVGILIAEVSGLANPSYDTSAGQSQTAPGTGTDAVTSTTLTPGNANVALFGYELSAVSTTHSPTVPAAGSGFTSDGTGVLWTGAAGMGVARARLEHKTTVPLGSTSAVAATFTAPSPGDSGPYLGLAFTLLLAGATSSPPIIYGARRPISLYQSNRAVPTYVGTQFFPGFSQGGFAGSAALSSFGASGTMLVTFAATGSAAMSSFASSGSAAETFASSGSAALKSFATAGTSSETFSCTGSAALSSFTSAGAAAEGFACTGSAALSSFASSGSGAETFIGSGTAACSPFGATGNSSTGTTFTCSGTAALSSFAVTGSATETFAATGSAALSPFAAAGAAAEAFIGSGSAALSPFAASGNAAMGTVFVFSGSAALSSFGASGTGAEAFVGAGTAAMAPFSAAGVGNLVTDITGSGSAALSSFSAAGSAATLLDIAFSGSAALSPFGALGGDPLVYLPSSKSRWVTAVNLSPFARFGPPFKVGGT
jgi:hypothetical protein